MAKVCSPSTFTNHLIISFQLIGDLQTSVDCWHSLATSYDELCNSVADKNDATLETLTGLKSVSTAVATCTASLRKLQPAITQEYVFCYFMSLFKSK